MPLSITSAMEQFRTAKTHRLAACWKIEREDGTVFRFTSHNQKIVLQDGQTYTPVGATVLDANRRQADAGEHSTAAMGAISSSAITSEDLFAGLYRGAKVTEYLVDWLYPWAGILSFVTYWWQEVDFDGESWRVQTAGLTTIAQRNAGDVYSRDCNTDLGSTKCGLTKATWTSSGTVSSVVEAQRTFRTGLTQADDYFNWGELTWNSGLNAGVTSSVKTYVNANGEIELHLQTPFAIQAGDTFSVVAGCDGSAEACKDRFSNLDNFRGFPFIPGADRAWKYP